MMYDEAKLFKVIEERKDELFKLLCDMIEIDSQNWGENGREEPMAMHLAEKFKELGLEPDVFSPLSIPGITEHPDYYAGRNLEKRYNCAAIWPGSDHSHRVMLAAHEDTVIVGDEALWKYPPLKATIADGRIYGRGACDDKYGIALFLFLCRVFKDLGIELPYDVVMMGYSDEEVGGSNGALAAGLKYPCDAALNLDGHFPEIAAAGVGGGELKMTLIADYPADSAKGVLDAFEVARTELSEFARVCKEGLENEKYYKGTLIPETTLRYKDVKTGYEGSAMGKLVAIMTVYTKFSKEEAFAYWEDMRTRINEKIKHLNVHCEPFEMNTRFFRYVENNQNNKAMNLAAKKLEEVTGTKVTPNGMCLSDFPMFVNHVSDMSICFGCGRSFEMEGGAHQFNEFIDCNDYLMYTKAIAAWLNEMSFD